MRCSACLSRADVIYGGNSLCINHYKESLRGMKYKRTSNKPNKGKEYYNKRIDKFVNNIDEVLKNDRL